MQRPRLHSAVLAAGAGSARRSGSERGRAVHDRLGLVDLSLTLPATIDDRVALGPQTLAMACG